MVKKLKLLLVVLLCVGAMPTAMAQITEGEPSAKVIRTGNRPEAGNFGLYMGATSNMFKGLFDGDIKMEALPLLNLKYMASDQFELRVGLELYRSMEKLNGVIPNGDATVVQNERYTEGTAMLYPGFAYHFSRHNIFDVYVGAELPIGWNRNNVVSEQGSTSSKTTKSSFTIGLGAFVGVQAFIANLPLAIGVEYGISSRIDTSLKYKNVYTFDGKTQTSISPDVNSFKHLEVTSTAYDKLKAKVGGIGSQFRVTLSYYFK
ncbi:MAG: hypothetical protein IJX40_05870 [Alistipes sp.]|nr:hypothetical protein [Alistipes sp.]